MIILNEWNLETGHYEDGFTLKEACEHPDNMLKPVFKDGKLLSEQSLKNIRKLLNVW